MLNSIENLFFTKKVLSQKKRMQRQPLYNLASFNHKTFDGFNKSGRSTKDS